MKKNKQEKAFFNQYKNDTPNDHHTIRISLYGEDIPENIITIPSSLHTLIHQKMDIGYKAIRGFRKKYNGILYTTPSFWEDLTDLRMREFHNIDKIPKELAQGLSNKLIDQLNLDLIDTEEDLVEHIPLKTPKHAQKVTERALERIGELKAEQSKKIMDVISKSPPV